MVRVMWDVEMGNELARKGNLGKIAAIMAQSSRSGFQITDFKSSLQALRILLSEIEINSGARRVIFAPVVPNHILRQERSGFLSSPFITDDIVSTRPFPARSFVPQHDVLTSVLTYKAGFPYTPIHPKRVLITF
jgi:hypothetical protein